MQSQQTANLKESFNELKRRKVIRTLIGYALFAWVILQIVDFSFEPLHLPDWMATVVVIAIILGFPIVAILSWAFDWTADGIKRAEASSGLKRWQTSLILSIMLLPVLVLSLFFYHAYGDFIGTQISETEQAAALTQANGDVQPATTVSSQSIAILPLADFDSTGVTQQMGDGLAEEILNLLAKNPAFEVAARTSSFAFRETTDDIKTIGQKLGVYWVLEGSVRGSGNLLRITVQLIDANTGFHAWSETYDREVSNSLETQDEIAALIASTLNGVLSGMQAEQASRYTLADYESFQNFNDANALLAQRTPETLAAAIKLYQAVIELHADYAPAYAGLSDAYMLESVYGNRSISDAAGQAQQSLELALGLDGKLGQAWASLGLIRARSGLNDSAESAYLKAIKLNPDYPWVYAWFGNLLGRQGRISEQQNILEEAQRLVPDDPFIRMIIANNHLARGELEQGFQLLNSALEQSPDSMILLNAYTLWSIQYGRIEQAVEQVRMGKLIEPDNPRINMTEAYLSMLMDQPAQAVELMTAAYAKAPNNIGIAGDYASMVYFVGDTPEIYQYFSDNYQLLNPIDRGEAFDTTRLRIYAASLAWVSGDTQQASELVHLSLPQLAKLDGTPEAIDLLSQAAWLCVQAGDTENAGQLLEISELLLNAIKENNWDTPALAYSTATLQAVNGQVEIALDSLEQAIEKGWNQFWMMRSDPRLSSLRENQRFTALMR